MVRSTDEGQHARNDREKNRSEKSDRDEKQTHDLSEDSL